MPGETPLNQIIEVDNETLGVITPDERLYKCSVAKLRDGFINLKDLRIVEYLQMAHPTVIAQYEIPQVDPNP